MANETTPTTPAAEAANDAAAAEAPMTAERAREILRTGDVLPKRRESDPLISMGEQDPLTAFDEAGELLQEVVEEVESRVETTNLEADDPAKADEPEAEDDDSAAPAVDDEVETQAAAGRRRLNINRKSEDGKPVYDARERAILQLSADEGISLREAEARLFGESRPEGGKEKTAETSEVKTGEVKPSAVEALTAELAALKQKRKEAVMAFDAESQLDIEEQIDAIKDRLNEAQTEAKMEARDRAAQERQEKASAAQSFEQRVESSMSSAEKAYPDSVKAGTALFDALNKELAGRPVTDPIFQLSDWPEMMAAKVAMRLGIGPVQAEAVPGQTGAKAKSAEAASTGAPMKPAAAGTPAAAKPAVVPVRRATPVPSPGGVAGGGPSPVQDLSARIQAAKAKGDVRALQALMREAEKLGQAA